MQNYYEERYEDEVEDIQFIGNLSSVKDISNEYSTQFADRIRHELIDQGNNVFECSNCAAQFVIRGDDFPRNCDFCGVEFTTGQSVEEFMEENNLGEADLLDDTLKDYL